MMERVNLAYSRIMIGTEATATQLDPDEDIEKQKDMQFHLMVKLVKDIESTVQRPKMDNHSMINAYASTTKQRHTFDLTLAAARSIYVKRKKYSNVDQFHDT